MAGKSRVPNPATGTTAMFTGVISTHYSHELCLEGKIGFSKVNCVRFHDEIGQACLPLKRPKFSRARHPRLESPIRFCGFLVCSRGSDSNGSCLALPRLATTMLRPLRAIKLRPIGAAGGIHETEGVGQNEISPREPGAWIGKIGRGLKDVVGPRSAVQQ